MDLFRFNLIDRELRDDYGLIFEALDDVPPAESLE